MEDLTKNNEILKEEIHDIIDNLLCDCYNDCYECEEVENADLIYESVQLYTLKLKDALFDKYGWDFENIDFRNDWK